MRNTPDDDYRMRAEELRMRAASIRWTEARVSLLKVAETYDALAQISRQRVNSDIRFLPSPVPEWDCR